MKDEISSLILLTLSVLWVIFLAGLKYCNQKGIYPINLQNTSITHFNNPVSFTGKVNIMRHDKKR